MAIYYLKYTNTTINWPAPIPVIAFAIGAIMGIFALLSLLQIVQWMGLLSFIATWLLAPIVAIVGSAMMAWFTYREWQASKTASA
jgi:phosphate/sulfate permease